MTHRPLVECYVIEGSKGTLTLECYGQWSTLQVYSLTAKLYRNSNGINSCCTDVSPQPQTGLDIEIRESYSYSGELRYFAECVLGGKNPEYCSGEDGLAAIEAVNAAYLSAYRNQTITLPLNSDYYLEEIFHSLGGHPRVHRPD